MNKSPILLAAVALFAIPAIAFAQSGTVTGAAGGAVTGAIVGGPVGAVVGGVVGAIAGTALAPPPVEVHTYVMQQKVVSYSYAGEVAVGRPVSDAVILYSVPSAPAYGYAYVNNRYLIIDPKTHIVVAIDG